MPTSPTPVDQPAPLAVIPVSRTRAFTRGLLRLVPALLVGLIVRVLLEEIWFREAGLRNRLVDAFQWILVIPFPILFMLLTISAARWLILAAWPGAVGFFAFADRLEVRLGPFGTRRYDVRRLRVRYFYELDDDENEGGFEAYLPEEEQLRHYLPRLHHPDAPRPIHQQMLTFAAAPETVLAGRLRPAADAWRRAPAPPEPPDGLPPA